MFFYAAALSHAVVWATLAGEYDQDRSTSDSARASRWTCPAFEGGDARSQGPNRSVKYGNPDTYRVVGYQRYSVVKDNAN